MNAVDLFCGGGGLSYGLSLAGINILEAIDNWQEAIDFYSANINGHKVTKMDLRNVDDVVEHLKCLGEVDMIAGGPPCQDFSSAGKRDDNGGRADLSIAYAKIVSSLKPRYFIMENVDRALKSSVYQEALNILRDAGYGLTITVLDASFCGVPQKRKRAVVIGIQGGEGNEMAEILKAKQSDKPMTLRDYFGDRLGIEHYYRHPRSYARRGIFSIDEPSPTIRGVNRPVPKGYPGHAGDSAPITPETRPLTTKERSMIQTFPEEWQLVGKKSDVEQIIGNAVPVQLGRFIGDAVLEWNKVMD